MRTRRILLPLLLAIGLLALPAVSQAYITGIADENASMFTSPLYQQIIQRQPARLRISRYIAPYDVADGNRRNNFYLSQFDQWYADAVISHVTPLVAFYHSELTPTRMPSVAIYARDVRLFLSRYPAIRQYQPWNEANRGNVRHLFSSPSAFQSALYYRALRHVCPHCTILGLDVLDSANIRPTLGYIGQFKSALHRLRVPIPHYWGLHNYSDTNRHSSMRTRAVLGDVPGQVWLTETGGIVKFGGAFPNRNGSGDRRAAQALAYMFRLAGSNRRLARLYIFQWTGAGPNVRFDAGLTDIYGRARPGYVVVCKKLHGRNCRVPVDSKH